MAARLTTATTLKTPDWHKLDIRLLAVLASLFISVFTVIFHGVPNDDAYTYVRTAEIFQSEGLAAAFDYYAWAGYPVAVGLLQAVLPTDLITTALIFNALFYALLVYAYLSIIREIDASPGMLALAALVILVYPQLAEFRFDVIRDVGFWALGLTALWQFILFHRDRHWRHAAFFVVCLLLGALLRAEAVIYLLLTPLALLADRELSTRRRFRFVLIYLGGALAALILAWALLRLLGLDLVELLTSYLSVYGGFLGDSLFPSPQRQEQLAALLFNEHAAYFSGEYLWMFLLAGFTTVLLGNLFNGLGGPYLFLLAMGAPGRQPMIPRHVLVPLLTYGLISLLILLVFLFITRFLTARYTMVLCLSLAVLLPVAVHRLLHRAAAGGRLALWRNVVGVLLLYCAIDAYVGFGIDKSYLLDAATWVRTETPAQNRLLTNNHAIAYYSQRVPDYDMTPGYVSAEEILEAPAGSLLVVEYNYDMLNVLLRADVAASLQLLSEYPADDDPRLGIYRRNTNP
ncbi:MAG: hypothetical protein RLZZ385_2674 [Pseudomonadota bacterium]|jgi:hypothetical protein